MYQHKKIAVVVPAYNEEKLIGRVIETVPRFVDRVYVIDDCSTDGTCEKAEAYLGDRADRQTRVCLLRHVENQGVGAAIVTGYKEAMADGMDVVAVMAGDGQMDPDDLPRVIEPVVLDHADYVKGNRLFTGEAWQKIPRYRYLGNATLSLLTKIASGYWHVADSQTGYTAISREALEHQIGHPEGNGEDHSRDDKAGDDFRKGEMPLRHGARDDIGERPLLDLVRDHAAPDERRDQGKQYVEMQQLPHMEKEGRRIDLGARQMGYQE